MEHYYWYVLYCFTYGQGQKGRFISMEYLTLITGLVIGFLIGRLLPLLKKFKRFIENEQTTTKV